MTAFLMTTRTTHAHNASRSAVQRALRMRIGHVDEMSERSRTTTVESSMKSEHNLYLACEDSTTCIFLLSFLLFSSCPLSFYCTLALLLSLNAARPSAAFSTRFCKTHMLRRTSRIVLPFLNCQEVPFFLVLYR